MSKITKFFVSATQHPVSKLRLVNYEFLNKKKAILSKRERSLYEKRAALQAWNQEYWCKNNLEFQQVRSFRLQFFHFQYSIILFPLEKTRIHPIAA